MYIQPRTYFSAE